jgi:hypothetical protein
MLKEKASLIFNKSYKTKFDKILIVSRLKQGSEAASILHNKCSFRFHLRQTVS